MFVFEKSGCNREKNFYSGKISFTRAKVVVIGQGCSIREKVLVIMKKWLYLEKGGFVHQSGGIRAKVVVFGQKWFYSGKVVVFGQ